MDMISLATPYSHPDSHVREARYDAACRAAATLMQAGELVFSPVVQSHPLARYGVPTAWDDWERSDRVHLTHCTELLVLLDGWPASVGGARPRSESSATSASRSGT